jgi:hypothetical protein
MSSNLSILIALIIKNWIPILKIVTIDYNCKNMLHFYHVSLNRAKDIERLSPLELLAMSIEKLFLLTCNR